MVPILKTEEQRKAFMEAVMWVSRTQLAGRQGYHRIRVRDNDDTYVLYEGNGIVLFVSGDGRKTRFVDGIEAKLVRMAAWPYYEGDL
jgi:hypothetical protein